MDLYGLAENYWLHIFAAKLDRGNRPSQRRGWSYPPATPSLTAYAGAYRQTYGSEESVAELISFMLGAFLAGDRGFAKAQKGGVTEVRAAPPEKSPRSRKPEPSSATAPTSSTAS